MTPVSQAVVLVGGLGTRLGSLTASTPKPMLPVGGRPFLEYVIAFLRRNEINRVLFCVSHLGNVIRDHFGNGARFGLVIDYGMEPNPSGTGGALVLAADKLDESFFVLNGDTIFDIPMQRLPESLGRHPAATAAMALRRVDDAARYGSVRVKESFVEAFEEKGGSGPGCISGGIYCLKREAVDLLPAGPSSLERDLFPRLAVNRQLCGETFDDYFIDIGLPETLARAQAELLSRFQLSANPPHQKAP